MRSFESKERSGRRAERFDLRNFKSLEVSSSRIKRKYLNVMMADQNEASMERKRTFEQDDAHAPS